MIDPELLRILCCPETHQTLAPAPPDLIGKLNQLVAAGQLRTRDGKTVADKLEEGLVRADGRFLYPIRSGIPVMLIDEAVPLPQPS
jgi:uncharacterized protein YbaR (Trm112 family)